MDHKAEFELLVMKKLNTNTADKIDWQTPRLLCIASDSQNMMHMQFSK